MLKDISNDDKEVSKNVPNSNEATKNMTAREEPSCCELPPQFYN